MKNVSRIFASLLLLMSIGCVSVLNHAGGGGIIGQPSDGPYPGVRSFINEPPSLTEPVGLLWVDFPFTFVLDTLLLPFDIFSP